MSNFIAAGFGLMALWGVAWVGFYVPSIQVLASRGIFFFPIVFTAVFVIAAFAAVGYRVGEYLENWSKRRKKKC